MRKLKGKQLKNVIRQIKKSDVDISSHKTKKTISFNDDYEKNQVITTWNHEKGSLAKFIKRFYFRDTGVQIEPGDIALIIGDSYFGSKAKENCFYILINSFVILVNGSYFRMI
tara:strand:- start:11608 stop:11946 length:339 start_codon:yes stop_codon:yes gene_type:complete